MRYSFEMKIWEQVVSLFGSCDTERVEEPYKFDDEDNEAMLETVRRNVDMNCDLRAKEAKLEMLRKNQAARVMWRHYVEMKRERNINAEIDAQCRQHEALLAEMTEQCQQVLAEQRELGVQLAQDMMVIDRKLEKVAAIQKKYAAKRAKRAKRRGLRVQ